MSVTFIPVILAGGSGTRLWPLSRQLHPKQLLALCADGTMLQETAVRACDVEPDDSPVHPLIVCNEEHRFLIAEQLRETGIQPLAILLEPVGRNTAPALTAAALAADDDEAVLFVTPADHDVKDRAAYRDALERAAQWAKRGAIVTFGIVPTTPETGYGYIRRGRALESKSDDATNEAFAIDAFVEKPDAQTAEHLLADGGHYWNSGMFMVRADRWLELIGRFRPEILAACRRALETGKRDCDFHRLDAEAFGECPSDSIDYAVMEPLALARDDAVSAVVIPTECGWSDVGAWNALWEVQSKDADGNVVRGDVFTANTRNCLVYGQQRFIATLGLKDTVVVETADAILVADKASVQDVKTVVQWLQREKRDEHLNHTRVYRPWGSY